MKQTTDSSFLKWWFNLDSLKRDNLCKKYFPLNQYYNLQEKDVASIHQQETNPKAIIDSGVEEKWTSHIQPSNNGLITTINCGTKRIAEVYHNGNIEEHEANAKLICEAVNNYSRLRDENKELLAALKVVVASLETFGESNAWEESDDQAWNIGYTTLKNYEAKNQL